MTTAVYIQSQSSIPPVLRAVIILTTDENSANPTSFFSSPTVINQLCDALGIDSSLWYLAQTALYGVNTFETRQSYTFYVVLVEQGVTIDLSLINSGILTTGGASGAILIQGPQGVTGPAGAGLPNPAHAGLVLYSTDNLITDVIWHQLTQDDILPGFSITGFSGGSTVEVGATVTNPSFSASYSSLPISANITNTDSIDSPLILTTPFTSGTVVGSFSHSIITSVVFTLTAISTSTKTANQSISYLARSFGGVGTAGATSATASGSNATLVGASGTLSNEGLHGSDVGQSYGPFSPSGQKIYLLLPHSATHTFHDQNGFLFAMSAPTNFSFTNQNGAVLSYDLYESVNPLSTSFTITVVS